LNSSPAQPRSKHGWCWTTPPEARLQPWRRQVTDRIQTMITLIETGGYEELSIP